MEAPIKYVGKNVKVIVDRPLGTAHPEYEDFIYPINYGYIPNTVSGDGKELDCYILGETEPLKEFTGKCIAVVHRFNDNEDKLVVSNKEFSDDEIRELVNFQEQYFESEIMRG